MAIVMTMILNSCDYDSPVNTKMGFLTRWLLQQVHILLKSLYWLVPYHTDV